MQILIVFRVGGWSGERWVPQHGRVSCQERRDSLEHRQLTPCGSTCGDLTTPTMICPLIWKSRELFCLAYAQFVFVECLGQKIRATIRV